MNYIKISLRNLSFLILAALVMTSCDPLVLPDVGEIPDATPPAADFSYEQNEGDWKQVDFANLSISATDYLWDFGGGNTTTDANPSFTYDTSGVFTVSLTATDKLNQTSTVTKEIVVGEPVVTFTPEILNPGFDIEGDDSYRNNWRNSDLGGVIQITSSPVHQGVKSAKLPSGGDRIGYQLITVQANKEYTVSFYYTMKTSPAGDMTVAILAGHITDPAAVAGATLNSVTVNDQSSASDYLPASVTFNSGNNTEVAIFFSNQGVESRIDTFTIVEN